MTARSFTRAAFLAGIASIAAFAAAPEAFAARNADVERYVQENASAALRTLGDRSMPTTQRRQLFDQLMAQFADMPRIANFVLGRYSASLRADAALRTEWNRTFQEYMIAIYEDQLQAFNGSTIHVTNSVERDPGRDVIVHSEMRPRSGGTPMQVQWRLLRAGAGWKVVDVALAPEGNQIWLAQQQQQDFLAQLGRSNGDIRGLMGTLRTQTAAMRQRIMARS